ncbi:nitrate ABC transporter substrate-binding protein [Lampropedia puyangensis]|uniref:Nitrate ABC transporter substrate-binding protein n=1 Tax=Lampropedia puyangensis TaxID=1330072 RepID=A0A4S8EWB4_9BURK|nr:nitrate ABC transporter substrate-binding protein [Lampropedia puyangensis]THT98104.1 nitrate ABC transporter substrate-binding protein [Lampropedia puyangensis]
MTEQSQTLPTLSRIRLAPNGPVFDLPILVALEHGLFAREGLDVQFVEHYDPSISSAQVFERQKESLFEQGKADAYNLCEWAGLDRSEHSQRGSKVQALRPAVAAQAILSFDRALQEPRDLAGVPVGVNNRTGSHYTALQLLGGALAKEEVNLVHAGSPLGRYEALKSGQLRAAALMEPYISLALKEGAHIIAVNFYRGAEVISPDLSEAARQAYLRVLNEAADLITADFSKYKHYIVAPVKEWLSADELHNHFVHYAHAKPLEAERFDGTYAFMRNWSLTAGAHTYKDLVAQ